MQAYRQMINFMPETLDRLFQQGAKIYDEKAKAVYLAEPAPYLVAGYEIKRISISPADISRKEDLCRHARKRMFLADPDGVPYCSTRTLAEARAELMKDSKSLYDLCSPIHGTYSMPSL